MLSGSGRNQPGMNAGLREGDDSGKMILQGFRYFVLLLGTDDTAVDFTKLCFMTVR